MKNKKSNILVVIIVIIIAITLIMPLTMFDRTVVAPTPENAPRNDGADPNFATTTPVAEKDMSDIIVVTTPTNGTVVTSSPLTVKGKARGGWYFEASFPIEIVNEDSGLIIGRGYGQADGDWQTSNFVPFTATVTFTKPATTTKALLILRNDNPSGDPKRAESITIPITIR